MWIQSVVELLITSWNVCNRNLTFVEEVVIAENRTKWRLSNFNEIVKNCRFSVENDVFSKLLKNTTKTIYVRVSFYKKTHWLDEDCSFCVYCSRVKCRKNKSKMWCNDDDNYLFNLFVELVDIFESCLQKTMKFENLNYYCYWKIVDESQRIDKRFSTDDKCELKNFYKRFVVDNKRSKKSLFVILVQWKKFFTNEK